MYCIKTTYQRLINFSIDKSWDADKQRAYRQVNEFNLLTLFFVITSLPITIYYKTYITFTIQIICLFLYLTSVYSISQKKLNKARQYSILTFEFNILLHCFTTVYYTDLILVPWYTPVFILVVLYPLLAALFDLSILRHSLYGLFQIIIIQIVSLFTTILFPGLINERYTLVLDAAICFYGLGLSAIIVFLIYSENKHVKVLEIERSKELAKALAIVESNNTTIQKQAEELKRINNSKDKLFSIIAHDLKSPYNLILGFAETLKEKSNDNPEYNKYAIQIYNAALHNYSLLENLLEWSRTQLDHIRYEPGNFSMIEIIDPTISLISVIADKKEVKIINQIDSSLIVWADKNHVNIIVRNLLSNAVKFSKPGDKIVLSYRRNPLFAEIAIKDNGIGMPEKMVKELFNLESKQSRIGTSSEPGTGLGLFLCKEFVEKHGGKLWVESKEFLGTTFYFTVPLHKDSFSSTNL